MVCRALLIEPQILLLDEQTAGMDAISSRQMWNLLRRLNQKGLTIVLTTHYIDEAQSLCDRVALIEGGKLNTVDAPQNLIKELGAYTVDVTTEEKLTSHYFHQRQEALDYISSLHIDADASMRNTTLEDVFVERVGKRLGKK